MSSMEGMEDVQLESSSAGDSSNKPAGNTGEASEGKKLKLLSARTAITSTASNENNTVVEEGAEKNAASENSQGADASKAVETVAKPDHVVIETTPAKPNPQPASAVSKRPDNKPKGRARSNSQATSRPSARKRTNYGPWAHNMGYSSGSWLIMAGIITYFEYHKDGRNWVKGVDTTAIGTIGLVEGLIVMLIEYAGTRTGAARAEDMNLSRALVSRIRRRQPMWPVPILKVLNIFQQYKENPKAPRIRGLNPSNDKGFIARAILYAIFGVPCVLVNPLFMAALFLWFTSVFYVMAHISNESGSPITGLVAGGRR